MTHLIFKYLYTHLYEKLFNSALMDLLFQDSQPKGDTQEVNLKELYVDGHFNNTEM